MNNDERHNFDDELARTLDPFIANPHVEDELAPRRRTRTRAAAPAPAAKDAVPANKNVAPLMASFGMTGKR